MKNGSDSQLNGHTGHEQQWSRQSIISDERNSLKDVEVVLFIYLIDCDCIESPKCF